jgi:hypothetical protein
MEELTSDTMTVESRVSRVSVCTRVKTQTLQGIQLTLTDIKTDLVTKLQPIGLLNDTNTSCNWFDIDTSSDYLRIVRIGYNSTGVFGIELQTYQNKTGVYGLSVKDPTLTTAV